jgi:hypothetical protein
MEGDMNTDTHSAHGDFDIMAALKHDAMLVKHPGAMTDVSECETHPHVFLVSDVLAEEPFSLDGPPTDGAMTAAERTAPPRQHTPSGAPTRAEAMMPSKREAMWFAIGLVSAAGLIVGAMLGTATALSIGDSVHAPTATVATALEADADAVVPLGSGGAQ